MLQNHPCFEKFSRCFILQRQFLERAYTKNAPGESPEALVCFVLSSRIVTKTHVKNFPYAIPSSSEDELSPDDEPPDDEPPDDVPLPEPLPEPLVELPEAVAF